MVSYGPPRHLFLCTAVSLCNPVPVYSSGTLTIKFGGDMQTNNAIVILGLRDWEG